jgi:hypothetical protein
MRAMGKGLAIVAGLVRWQPAGRHHADRTLIDWPGAPVWYPATLPALDAAPRPLALAAAADVIVVHHDEYGPLPPHPAGWGAPSVRQWADQMTAWLADEWAEWTRLLACYPVPGWAA